VHGRFDLAIRGGRLVTAERTIEADLGVVDGRIAAIGDVPSGSASEEINARGLLLLPGVVDAHTHLGGRRTSERIGGTADDFESGTIAAACGGVTTVIDYARQYPGQSILDAIDETHARAQPLSAIDFTFHVIVTDFSEGALTQIGALVKAGFPSVKAFMQLIDDAHLLRLMAAAREAGAVVMLHAESGPVLDFQKQSLFAEGKRSTDWYVDSRPEIGEAEATSRGIDYADLTGADTCIVHLSCAVALERVRSAKARASRIRAEVRPCYLLLDRSAYERAGVDPLQFTGCPPLREAYNVDVLWSGVADGTLDIIASDHAAWTLEQKRTATDFSTVPQGIPGLETELAALWTAGVVAGKVSKNRLIEALSAAPARLHGLYPRKGTLAVGSDADIVLFDPNRVETITQGRLHSRTGYEPCEGMRCQGWPVATIARGDVIARDGEFVGRSGRGQLLRRGRAASAAEAQAASTS
jgi:dihydropyrimidinase